MRTYACIVIVLLPLMAVAQNLQNKIVIGERDTLRSSVLKETRQYWVYLPDSYDNNMFQSGRYPVIYLLDGPGHFHSVTGLVQFLGSHTSVIPEMIVVAIANTDRTRDLTPTHAKTTGEGKGERHHTSGGGDAFLQFLKTELIPHIDGSYRTAPYRIFIGHSFGGITTLNALYTIPETFNAYVSIDPSLWWDNQVLLEKARSHFMKANLATKYLYISQANTLVPNDTTLNDHFESIQEFATLLQTRNRSGLQWKYDYFGDDTHGSVPLISTYNALRFIFKEYPWRGDGIKTPEDLKEQYKAFSAKVGAIFQPQEQLINNLGYQAMAMQNYDLAQRYFQMNIDLYPKSANVYDSMAELLMSKGESKKSIDYYERSLKLNPQNDNARANIKLLQGILATKH